jgi:hypothetical protein
LLTLFASIVTSTAVVGLDPTEAEPPSPLAVAEVSEPVASDPAATDFQAAGDECSAYVADFCVEVPIRRAANAEDTADAVRSCSTGGEHQPALSLEVVESTAGPAIAGAINVRIEIEAGLAVDGGCFAGEVMDILADPRGWTSAEAVSFAQVADGSYDLRIILASPERTDSLCYPARTAGRFSCRKQDSVILNLMRWQSGTDEYTDDLSTYRTYLVNHEVGHFLGKGHLRCPGPGQPAPVMMQQTKGLGDCMPNGWPTKDES